MREKNLLIGFGIFLLITVAIGVIGLRQIHALTETIENLEQIYLPKQRAILELKTNNAFYAMGVRNYVAWRTSKYLGAASVAADIKFIEQAYSKMKEHLVSYGSLGDSAEHRDGITYLSRLVAELESMGRELIRDTDGGVDNKDKTNRLLISFENKFYKIDEFLSANLSKGNLADIEAHLKLTYKQKDISITILVVSLFVSIILGVMITSLVYKSLRRVSRQREVLVRKMIRVEEEERKNLSRQIHDQLSQDLSALKIYLGIIEQGLGEGDSEQRARIEKSKKLLDNLVEKGHNISELLRPPELDDLGLVETIAALVAEQEKIVPCKYSYYRPDTKIKLAPEHSLALYRVVQELLTNIVKHAQAKNVTVSLQRRDRTVYLGVTDDGVGFDYNQYLGVPHRRQDDKLKLGLQGLRERIEFLGGKLIVKTTPGQGTEVRVELTT